MLALKIEHKVAEIIQQQVENGVLFDVNKALELIGKIYHERRGIEERLRPYLLPHIEKFTAIYKPFKLDGGVCIRASKRLGPLKNDCLGPFTPINILDPVTSLSSRNKLIAQLQHYGWKPSEYTEKGNPKITEESFASIREPIGMDIMRWYILAHRNGLIQGLLKNVRPDGRLEAQADTLGTPTGRFRHKIVVNIPKASKDVVLGYECRELFTVPDGYIMMGWDASGLELRILAHYMNDDRFTEAVVNGRKEDGTDIHTLNAKALGSSRDTAKTFIYGYLYGAGDSKLGSIIGGGEKEGKELRRRFVKNYPRLGRLVERVRQRAKAGYLVGLDGRHMPVRSEHSALNTLIQGGGAVFMKTFMCMLDYNVKKNNIPLRDAKKVIDMHDEHQWEVKKDGKLIELLSNLVVLSSTQADKMLNLRCKNEFEIKVGNNWAETH